jgi:hypothetical protein
VVALRTLGRVSWRKLGLSAWLLVALASLLFAWWFDKWFPTFGTDRPVAANVVASGAVAPAEFFAGYVAIAFVVRRNRERRWATAAQELTEAIGQKWDKLRELLLGLFWVEKSATVAARISAAESVWQELAHQERALARRRDAGLPVEWDLPGGLDDTLGGIAEVWFVMWAAGSAQDRQAWQRRLTAVLLPRLSLDDPEVTAAARRLVDTLSDLEDLLAVLSDRDAFTREEPWPWELSDPEVDPLVVGLAKGQLADLSELRQVLDLAGEAVRRGDHLMGLLNKQSH